MTSSSKVIRISLEVEAPVCGTSVSVSGPDGRTVEQKIDFAAGTTTPSPGLTPTKVSDSGSTSGEICVKGNTGTSHDKIFVALDSVSFPSSEFATTDWAGNWQGLLGGVSCGSYATPVAHTIRVWHQDHLTGVVEGPEVINFQAFCAPYHECESPVSAQRIGIPVAWPEFRVVATGFKGDRKHFNGDHIVKLSARQSNQSTVVWSSQAKSQTASLVCLCLIRVESPHWKLEFRTDNDHVVYYKSAAQWNAVGANVLTEPSGAGGTAAPSVEVHPVLD